MRHRCRNMLRPGRVGGSGRTGGSFQIGDFDDAPPRITGRHCVTHHTPLGLVEGCRDGTPHPASITELRPGGEDRLLGEVTEVLEETGPRRELITVQTALGDLYTILGGVIRKPHSP